MAPIKASAGNMQFLGHTLYLTVLLSISLMIPSAALSQVKGVVFVIGVVGLWRYAWAATNFGRAIWYQRVAFPRMKRRVLALHAARKTPPHAFFLVTSFKIEPEVTTRVYQSIFLAAAAAHRATVIASVVEGADARLIRTIFAQMRVDMTTVTLRLDQIAGTGKRDALAKGLRVIAALAPTWRDIVIFVDGDSCVPSDIVDQSAPWFSDTTVGALTTDEQAEILDAPTFRDWFALRFTQRHVLMSSMALAGRVLTLTGRMSVFRADLATNPGFIAQVHSDHLQHWRLGRVTFLTGDDKSTWFWLLKSGYRMLYLPDVRTLSMERQPLPGFIASATTLMVRWYGNMMRTNGRALALPVARIGAFTWWSLLDQRITIWTTLAGPLGVMLTAIFTGPWILMAYLAWVLFTRYVFCLALTMFRGTVFPIRYPFLLYFGQIMGAAVKSFVLFRLDRQRWTRQATGAARQATTSDRISTFIHVLTLGWLTLGVTIVSGLL